MSRLEVPTLPAVSPSRSLTTLIHECSIELPDSVDLLHDDSLPSSFVDFDDCPEDDPLDKVLTKSPTTIASILDELERIAAAVKKLPGEEALSPDYADSKKNTSADPRFSSHFYPGEETLEELKSLSAKGPEVGDSFTVRSVCLLVDQ